MGRMSPAWNLESIYLVAHVDRDGVAGWIIDRSKEFLPVDDLDLAKGFLFRLNCDGWQHHGFSFQINWKGKLGALRG